MNRKIGLLALTLALTATLAGCGNPGSSVDPTPSAPAVAPTDSPTPSATNTPGIVGQGRMNGGMWSDELGRDAGDMARGAVNGAGNAARDAIDGAGDVVRGAVDGVGDVARGAANGVGDMFRGVGNAAQDVGNGIANAAR